MEYYQFYEQYFIRKKLINLAKKEGVDVKIYGSNADISYVDLDVNKVFLPFLKKYSFGDLKILFQHELLHIKKSKKMFISDEYEFNYVNNLIEDIYINQFINKNKLISIFKKISKDKNDFENMKILLWKHLNEDEKDKLLEKLEKSEVIIEKEKVKRLLEKILEERENHESNFEFNQINGHLVKQLASLFRIATPQNYQDNKNGKNKNVVPTGLQNILSNGPSNFPSSYANLPDFELLKKISKLINNLKSYSEVQVQYKKFYGKKINRKYVEDLTEIYPFKQKNTFVDVKKPNIIIILDCSGSMQGEPEKRAKAFIVPVLQKLNATLIAKNQYYTKITKNPQEAMKLYMEGDDDFDELPEKLKKYGYWPIKTDILISVSDLEISRSEIEGLNNVIEQINARKKYLLCVNEENMDKYEDIVKIPRISISDNEKMLNFVKKLTGQYQ